MHPQGVRAEAGERGRIDPHGAPRSPDPTSWERWERFCATYRPGLRGRSMSPATVRRELVYLQLILNGAFCHLDEHSPRPPSLEETTAGTCWEPAARANGRGSAHARRPAYIRVLGGALEGLV